MNQPSAMFPNGLPSKGTLNKKQKPLSQKKAQYLEPWFWGKSSKMHELKKELCLVQKCSEHVLIIGESGTGKELVAKELHKMRTPVQCEQTPFSAVNCANIPDSLAESILFGHERGAFTSARERQMGKFESALKGSLFLDEIQHLSLGTQAKLLRALEERKIERLGSKKTIEFHCQIIAASNYPLEFLIEQKRFREDLYFRLNVCPLYLPPLRERLDDLEDIMSGLFKKLIKNNLLTHEPSICPEVIKVFKNYQWPGNIRELQHALMYAALRCQDKIQTQHLPGRISGRLKKILKNGHWNFIAS